MKISKQARRDARELFRACLAAARWMKTASARPWRASCRKSRAVTSPSFPISSASSAWKSPAAAPASRAPTPLPPQMQAQIQADLTRQYGPGLSFVFAQNPALHRRRAHPGRRRCLQRQRAGPAGGAAGKFLKYYLNNLMSTLLQEIEAQISGMKTGVTRQNVGTVREIGDGVAKIEGLSDAMLNEMLDFGNGIVGLALNLEETEVGAIILGDYTGIKEGQEVRTTGKLLQVPVGKPSWAASSTPWASRWMARGRSSPQTFYPVEKIAPGIIKRQSVSQPVQTGIMAVDAMIPIGRGQRELIIGDRSTGKTTIGIDTIISQARLNRAAEAAKDTAYRPLYCIYVAIGQKQSNVARVIAVLEEAGAMPYTIIV